MMFDHGVDSLAVTTTLWNCKIILNMNSNEMIITFLVTKFLFILANYESAKLGGMFLPIFNGPSDGNVILTCLFCTPYFFGDDIFFKTFFFGF